MYKLTSRISASVIEPWISCLLAKTKSEAPDNRCILSVSRYLFDKRCENKRLPEEGCGVRPYSPACAFYRQNRRPKLLHLFARNSFSSRVGGCAGHRHPLSMGVRNHLTLDDDWPTYVQSISMITNEFKTWLDEYETDLLSVNKRFDIKSQRRADTHYIFSV